MGYEINSPVKQVWLPLDYGFLSEFVGGTFGEFSKEYQKKYGIDLHDIFILTKTADNEFVIGSKIDLVGTYNIDLLNNIVKTKIALTNGLATMTAAQQSDQVATLLVVYVGVGIDIAHGFTFVLPTLEEREVNSIDDISIGLYEI